MNTVRAPALRARGKTRLSSGYIPSPRRLTEISLKELAKRSLPSIFQASGHDEDTGLFTCTGVEGNINPEPGGTKLADYLVDFIRVFAPNCHDIGFAD